jgi:hypothetical protein
MHERIAIALICLLVAGPAMCADLLTTAQAKELAANVMKLVVADRAADAITSLKPYWPLPDSELEMLSLKIKSQYETINGRFGAAVGYEFVRERQVGDFLYEVTFVEKRQKHALPWRFIYYKSSKVWLINAVSFSDKIAELLPP